MRLLGTLRLLLLLLLIGSNVPSVLAHAALLSSEPADGAVIAEPPTQVVLRYSEPVSPVVLRLTTPEGATVNLIGARWRDDALVIPAPKGLWEGTYVVSWRVISQDGHPIGGSLIFSIGAKGGNVASVPSGRTWSLATSIWFLRVAFYLSLFLGVGGAVFLSWLVPNDQLRIERTVTLPLLAVFPVSVLSIGLLGIDALDAGWKGFWSLETWHAGLSSTYAGTAITACAASLFALSAQHFKKAVAKIVSAAAIALTGVAIAASGHAATAPPQFISRPAVFIHVVSLTIWIGSLLPLARLFLSSHPASGTALQRFSNWIPWPVGILIGTGVIISLLQLKPFGSLFTTPYGKVLLAKLTLVACLMVLAGYNRYRLTSRAISGDQRSIRTLVLSIGIELVLVAAILGTVALWRFTPPPRSLAPQLPPVSLHIHGQEAMAQVEITPGGIGINELSFGLMGLDQKPLVAKEVEVELSNPEAGIEPIRRHAKPIGNGLWSVCDLTIPKSGRWTLKLDILIDDFRSISLESLINVP
jgi:copper transport protein